MKVILFILLGYSIATTLYIILLINQPNITYQISRLKQVSKRNKDSNIKNDITPVIDVDSVKKPKKDRLLKRLINKRKLKKGKL